MTQKRKLDLQLIGTSKRIQRRRTAGWRMPPNTVYIGRPSIYGNPYVVGVDGTADECIALYRQWVDSNQELRAAIIKNLTGKDVADWCAVDAPCHGDVILEIINQPVIMGTTYRPVGDFLLDWASASYRRYTEANLLDSVAGIDMAVDGGERHEQSLGVGIEAYAKRIQALLQVSPHTFTDVGPQMDKLATKMSGDWRMVEQDLIAFGGKVIEGYLSANHNSASLDFIESLRSLHEEDETAE